MYIKEVLNKEDFKKKYGKKKCYLMNKPLHRAKVLFEGELKNGVGAIKFKKFDSKPLDDTYYIVIEEGYELIEGTLVNDEFEKDYFINEGKIIKYDVIS